MKKGGRIATLFLYLVVFYYYLNSDYKGFYTAL